MNFRALLRCVFALAVVAAFVLPVFADTIRLKDGSTIKGRITGFNGGKFTVAVGEGSRRREFTFSAGEIESIEFDRSEVLDRNVSTINTNVKTDSPVVNEQIVAETPAVSAPAPKTTQTTNYNPTKGPIKPVAINVSVLADSTSNGWTNS